MRFRREQYVELMTFGSVERQMFVELFGPLVGVADEWRAQGASEDEIGMVAFDWDFVPSVSCGGATGQFGGLEPGLIEETDEYVLERDSLGRTTKLCKGVATISLPLDYPVTDMDSWLRLKPWFEFSEARVSEDQVRRAKQAQAAGAMVVAYIPGGFDLPRQLMGDEAACLCYYEQPELMQDILGTVGDTAFRVLDRVSDQVQIDQLSVHEDLAGKSGSLVGPSQILAYIKPYYRRVWNMLAAKGTRIFQQDSDGNVNSVIDAFLDCGLTNMMPMEPAAGMDVVALRRKYGKRLAMSGGIDKHVLRQGNDAIRRELEYKMQPAMQEGGMVFSLDHRIPNGTPIANYRYYVDVGRELLRLPPRDSTRRGWQRMAF